MSAPTQTYPSDLTDAEWALLAPLIPAAKPGGRPRRWAMRAVLTAIFYLLRAGCAWRLLPQSYPPRSPVRHDFRQWRLDGTWEQPHTARREQERRRQGRAAQPSAAIVASQSVKATSVGGVRGYAGAKKLGGRQRHLLVGTPGLVLKVLEQIPEEFPRVEPVWADQGYTGSGKTWSEAERGWAVEIVRHTPGPRGEWRPIGDLDDRTTLRFAWVRLPPAPERFRGPPPRRWVVERTFGWPAQSRRLAKEYERLREASEALSYAAMSRIMLRRLARA